MHSAAEAGVVVKLVNKVALCCGVAAFLPVVSSMWEEHIKTMRHFAA